MYILYLFVILFARLFVLCHRNIVFFGRRVLDIILVFPHRICSIFIVCFKKGIFTTRWKYCVLWIIFFSFAFELVSIRCNTCLGRLVLLYRLYLSTIRKIAIQVSICLYYSLHQRYCVIVFISKLIFIYLFLFLFCFGYVWFVILYRICFDLLLSLIRLYHCLDCNSHLDLHMFFHSTVTKKVFSKFLRLKLINS